MSTPKAVLFDFSGTLFRFEARDDWFDDLHDEDGNPLHLDAQAVLIRRMTQPVGLPTVIEDDDRIAWEQRDLDPQQHRRAYLAMLRASGLTAPGHAEQLYARVLDPHSWQIFPDTEAVLRGLRAAGIPVGVVSNIAFDLRAVLALHGVADLVDEYALSYEVGAIKPNPRIFHAALDPLGVAPYDALMVGDSEEADGGARHLGCAFELVQDAPAAERPSALIDAVTHHGVVLPN
ncbi:HAD family hydrolase [Gordonia sp. SL306]|uniref:HAD family hydrolase n=1 Tax=Gordonia sp. SL306 TaxID=2995145 RepID=UPI0022715589|nr:HAD-IA family hydrolase [Gordonia sp. SL306]WAC54716.1 HAD-IA family hydrolase [Gordonia sp. SL306]